nr:PLP-dependent aminotransferase family protein [Paracoccus pantotrophus]
MLKYDQVVGYVQELVARGVVKQGDRLPSIRRLAKQLELSPITVQHGYDLLQSQGVIKARSRSGYFVSQAGIPSGEQPRRPAEMPRSVSVADLTYAILSQWHRQSLDGFGGINPHPSLIDPTGASRLLRQSLRVSEVHRHIYHPPEGRLALREGIARHLATRGLVVRPDQIVLTNLGLQGFELCLDVLTEPGDTVLLDTPTYLPLLMALQRKGLRVLEVFSHPVHGIDPDQLAYLLNNHRVRAAVLSPINHFPTGTTSSKETMQRIARVLEVHNTPAIEFDAFSDLTYRGSAPAPLMAYGDSDQITLFGSFLHVLGPDFGLGWVVTRNRSEAMIAAKFRNNLTLGDSALQRALADYMAAGRYERELRHLRRRLATAVESGAKLLQQVLSRPFSFSMPAGGYMCWVRGGHGFDAAHVAHSGLKRGIVLAPGPMFSPSEGFHNFFGVNLSAPWGQYPANQLARMSELLTSDRRPARSRCGSRRQALPQVLALPRLSLPAKSAPPPTRPEPTPGRAQSGDRATT